MIPEREILVAWAWDPREWRIWFYSGSGRDSRCMEPDERWLHLGPLAIGWIS